MTYINQLKKLKKRTNIICFHDINLKNPNNTKKIINNDLCSHKFINDTIDIHPEKSMNITYCKICEYTLL